MRERCLARVSIGAGERVLNRPLGLLLEVVIRKLRSKACQVLRGDPVVHHLLIGVGERVETILLGFGERGLRIRQCIDGAFAQRVQVTGVVLAVAIGNRLSLLQEVGFSLLGHRVVELILNPLADVVHLFAQLLHRLAGLDLLLGGAVLHRLNRLSRHGARADRLSGDRRNEGVRNHCHLGFTLPTSTHPGIHIRTS